MRPRRGRVVTLAGPPPAARARPPTLRRASQRARRGGGPRQDGTQRWQRNTVLQVDALLAFVGRARDAAALERSRPAIPPPARAGARGSGPRGSPHTQSPPSALAWGAAAGWSDAAFRVYYLGGALLTAALLGAGSLCLVGKRWIVRVALVYVGLAIGVAVAVPLQADISGTGIPDAQDVLDLWPARILAILGNSLGTLAVVAVAIATFRARPLGNALILAGIAVAGIGSGLAGTRYRSPCAGDHARGAPSLRGFRRPLAPEATPQRRAQQRPPRATPRRSLPESRRGLLATREDP